MSNSHSSPVNVTILLILQSFILLLLIVLFIAWPCLYDCHLNSLQYHGNGSKWGKIHEEPACMYSLPLLPSSSLLVWVYEAILPKHGCHIKQLLINAKVLSILIYCYYFWGGPPCTYCPNLSSNSTILPSNNLLIVTVCHSSINMPA